MKHRILTIKKHLVCRKIDGEIRDLFRIRKRIDKLATLDSCTLKPIQMLSVSLIMYACYPSKQQIYWKLQRRRQIIKSLTEK